MKLRVVLDGRQLRILHVYKDYPPVRGGIEGHVRVLAEAAASRGHDVTVLVASSDRRARDETLNGVRIVKTARWFEVASTPIAPAMLVQARRLGRAADVVHLHFPHPPGETAHLLSGVRARTVLTYHSDIVRQRRLLRLYRPLLARILARADVVVATSARYLETSPHLARVRDKCVVVPLGVDVARFARADPTRAAALRRRVAGPPDAPLVLAVGRLRSYKGLDTMMRALPLVPGARLAVVGTGPMEGAWRALAATLGVGGRVTFCGEADDDELPAWYHAADLFVLPAVTRAEAFGTVLLEAMAAGLACVTTEVGSGTSWVVQDGVTGRVVPPGDPAALARAVGTLLADGELRRLLGGAGAARARDTFDARTMIDRVLALYAAPAGRDARR
jgi:rhamnosyl/mannosyltransferase